MQYPTMIMSKTTAWRRNTHRALLITAAVMICGCGSTTDLSSVVSITADNYDTVSAKVVATMEAVIVTGIQGDTATDSVAGVTVTGGTGPYNLMDISRDAVQTVIAAQSQSPTLSVTGTSVATTVPCDKGDITVETIVDGGGTTYRLTFNNCDEKNLNYTLNGTATLSNVETSGDLSAPATPGSLAASVDLGAVHITARRVDATLQGTFDYSITSSDGVTSDQSIQGTKLTITQSGDSTIIYTYDFAVTLDSNTSDFSYTASGSLYSTALGGSVNFANTSPFTGVNLIADSPEHGAMRIAGRSNSNVTLNAGAAGYVTLNLDADGNGTVDKTQLIQWAFLR